MVNDVNKLDINLFLEDKEECDETPNSSPKSEKDGKPKGGLSPGKSPGRVDISPSELNVDTEIKEEEVKVPVHAQSNDPVSINYIFLYVLEDLII